MTGTISDSTIRRAMSTNTNRKRLCQSWSKSGGRSGISSMLQTRAEPTSTSVIRKGREE